MTNPEDNSASVAPGNRSAFGYTLALLWFYLFILLNMSTLRIVLTLVATICNMSLLNMHNLVVQFVMIYIMVLIWKLPNISTIQKPYFGSFPVPMASFGDALRP
jgi:hypothetical protein